MKLLINVDINSEYPEIYQVSTEALGPGEIVLYPNKPLYHLNENIIAAAYPFKQGKFITWKFGSISKNPFININVNSNINLQARFQNKIQTTRVLISDIDLTHANLIKNNFLQSYLIHFGSAFLDTIDVKIETNINWNELDNLGVEVLIRSTTGAQIYSLNSHKYYPIVTIMPAGSNDHIQIYNTNGNLPALILTGAGTVNNFTGYDIEVFADGINSSLSNAYLAGILVASVDSSYNNAGFKDYFAARYYLRKGKVWNNENGYGYLDYSDLIKPANVNEYLLNVASDPDYYRKLDPYLLL